MPETDRSTESSRDAPHEGVQLRNVVVGGDFRIGNVKASEIVGGTVIRGDGNTITVLDKGSGVTIDGIVAGRDNITVHSYSEKSYTHDLEEKEAALRSELQRQVQDLQRKPKEVISSEQALARIAEKTKFDVDQLRQNMDQARSESAQFFRVTLIFAGLGSAVIIGGVSLMMAGFGTAGLVTTAASLIPQATALLLFNKDKEIRRKALRSGTDRSDLLSEDRSPSCSVSEWAKPERSPSVSFFC
jgi:hypothetical protein